VFVMKKLVLVAAASCLWGSAMASQDVSTVITSARQALGDPKSITYSGSAKDVNFQQCGAHAGQPNCQGLHDPMRPITNYVRVIDLQAPASRHTGSTNNIAPGGSTTGSPGTFFQQVTPEQASLSQPWGQSLELYITPWGFLKGAAESNATVSSARVGGKRYTVLTWSPAVKAPSGKSYEIKGYLNDRNLIERVETWLGENIMGDMHILATYSGWKDFGGGAMAPTRIVQTRGGWPFFEADITAATLNPPNVAELAPAPANLPSGPPPGAGQPPALTVTTEKLGEGVFRYTTGPGTYDSMVVEFRDHIMVLEGGQGEARSLAYIAEIRKQFPNKPIRYVVNTHAHSDHAGGLPTYVAEGVTIVTHRNNKAFLERALNTPRTLLNDSLAKNPKRAKVEGVGTKKVYTDGNRRVELYHIYPAPHSNGLIVAYFPKEKVLFQGDFSLPAPGQPANAHVRALVPALEKLNVVDFERYINVHAPVTPQTKADLWKAVGK
jgi:glyoxylase-like metal-dependent hydrolase (beta-lactamase superfamily II)